MIQKEDVRRAWDGTEGKGEEGSLEHVFKKKETAVAGKKRRIKEGKR